MALLTDKETEKDLSERLEEFTQFGMVLKYMLDIESIDISDLETIFFDTDREKATLIYSKMLQGIKNDYIEKAFSIYSMVYKNNDEMPSEEYSYYLNKCCINDIICDINKSRKIDRTYFNTYDYLLNNRKFQRK